MKSKHRSSTLKQVNKKHKGVNKTTKGKTNKLPKSSRNALKSLSKRERKLQSKQFQLNKAKSLENIVQSRGGKNSAPLFCALIPLSEDCNPLIIQTLFKSCDKEQSVIPNFEQNYIKFAPLTLNNKRFKKRLTFACGTYGNLFACLDLAKIADEVIFLCSFDINLNDRYVNQLLLSLYGQGMPSFSYAVASNIHDIKGLKNKIENHFAKADVRRLNNNADAMNLMRHLCLSAGSNHHITRSLSVYSQRASLLVETIANVIQEGDLKDSLVITGCIRNQPLNPDSSLHLTGWGDFKILRVTTPDGSQVLAMGTPVTENNEEIETMEDDYDPDDGDLSSEEDDMGEMSDDDEDGSDHKNMSDCGGEISNDSDDDLEDMSEMKVQKRIRFSSDSKSEADSCLTTSGYSAVQLQKFRDARAEEEFPDEVETPVGIHARHRFAKYRGLAGFRSSEWSVDEDIPDDYRKIFKFKNYRHDRNRLMKLLKKGRLVSSNAIKQGTSVAIYLQEKSTGLFKTIADYHKETCQPLVAFQLLNFEDKISVVHHSMRRVTSARIALEEIAKENDKDDEAIDDRTVSSRMAALPLEAEPIKGKEPMLFQAGFRRYVCEPIYSEADSAADKFKMCRYFPAGAAGCVASMYAPVMYTPVPALQFRIRFADQDDTVRSPYLGELVATGSLLSVDPDRVLLKRIFLSGHPYKINKKSSVIRFMFHNPEDVLYFKPIELKTKWGRRGQIKEAIGTHGFMKCKFDKQLNAADVALMPLYKRVFPKWTYNPDTIKFTTSSEFYKTQRQDSNICPMMEVFE